MKNLKAKFYKINQLIGFFLLIILIATLLFGCLGRTRSVKEMKKSFLPEYMRRVYINDFFNQSQEPFLDLEIYRMLQDHYSSLNYEKKLATLLSAPNVKESRIILIPYLIEAVRKEITNTLTLVLEIDLKVTSTDRYLLKRKRLIIEADNSGGKTSLENAVEKFIEAIDDYVKNGSISYQY